MTLLLILKLIVVLLFLLFFWRRPSLTWGIGLLTVASAVLLDTFISSFGGAALRQELGFFYFVLSGVLFGGAAIWLWGVLRPFFFTPPTPSSPPLVVTSPAVKATAVETPAIPTPNPPSGDAFDRKMLYEQIHTRFGRSDILNLMFDLGIAENEVMTVDQTMAQVIHNIMRLAEERGQMAALALAVERILTPPPATHLPRLEKLSVASPPTILRQFLQANYTLDDLSQMARKLNIDWEDIGGSSKPERVREFLLYLYRRNRVDELIDLMQGRQPQIYT